MRIFCLITLLMTLVLIVGCGDDDCPACPDPKTNQLVIICPPDTIVPITCPTHPDSLGLVAQVTGSCAGSPVITFVDSNKPGGITRTWFAADSCGNSDVCVQTIGLGAPGPCE